VDAAFERGRHVDPDADDRDADADSDRGADETRALPLEMLSKPRVQVEGEAGVVLRAAVGGGEVQQIDDPGEFAGVRHMDAPVHMARADGGRSTGPGWSASWTSGCSGRG
jgi:hypothetical protein